MNRPQRVVLILYFVLLTYCCVWVPWHLVQSEDRVRAGYGWLWAGPNTTDVPSSLTTPDLSIIGLRLLAVTALAGAAFCVAAGRNRD
jgi:hypothetical protein